jgi:hypothetical protein
LLAEEDARLIQFCGGGLWVWEGELQVDHDSPQPQDSLWKKVYIEYNRMNKIRVVKKLNNI